MKVKNISIHGFRGFNEKCTIDFHEHLTLIYAPNSYGKTSISEAFEWLLYGVTYKVDNADSKEEYKGSYRNLHLPESLTPSVTITFVGDDGNENEFRAELASDEIAQRSANGQAVESWPLTQDISKVPKPFVLQNALKHLLLTTPVKRFQGFAGLLGLEELDGIEQNIINLCTKPEACVPRAVKQLLDDVLAIQEHLSSRPDLAAIAKSLKKKQVDLTRTYEIIVSECSEYIFRHLGEEEYADDEERQTFLDRVMAPFVGEPAETLSAAKIDLIADEDILPPLLKIRKDAVGKVFHGEIVLSGYSEREKELDSSDTDIFLGFVTETLVNEFTQLAALATVQHILDQAKFFDLGVKQLGKASSKCPFCGQSIDDAISEHIQNQHKHLVTVKESNKGLQKQRAEIQRSLAELKRRLKSNQDRHMSKSERLLALDSSLEQL